ncbi:MAG: hypothetical protein GXP04_00925 [Alphaproteobacteria bacterium]|nr:hypothetical protein [Alphaproteobacteria bacterium]
MAHLNAKITAAMTILFVTGCGDNAEHYRMARLMTQRVLRLFSVFFLFIVSCDRSASIGSEEVVTVEKGSKNNVTNGTNVSSQAILPGVLDLPLYDNLTPLDECGWFRGSEPTAKSEHTVGEACVRVSQGNADQVIQRYISLLIDAGWEEHQYGTLSKSQCHIANFRAIPIDKSEPSKGKDIYIYVERASKANCSE